jgi:hypothetical protein
MLTSAYSGRIRLLMYFGPEQPHEQKICFDRPGQGASFRESTVDYPVNIDSFFGNSGFSNSYPIRTPHWPFNIQVTRRSVNN